MTKHDIPKYPLEDVSEILVNGSDYVILGNGVCDSGVYNSDECDWKYGDCAAGQVGQDLQFLVFITSITTQDRSTLAVVSCSLSCNSYNNITL